MTSFEIAHSVIKDDRRSRNETMVDKEDSSCVQSLCNVFQIDRKRNRKDCNPVIGWNDIERNMSREVLSYKHRVNKKVCVRIDILSTHLPLRQYSGAVNVTLRKVKSLLLRESESVYVETVAYLHRMCCWLRKWEGIYITEAAAFLSSRDAEDIQDEKFFRGITLDYTHSLVDNVAFTEKERAYLERDRTWVGSILAKGCFIKDSHWLSHARNFARDIGDFLGLSLHECRVLVITVACGPRGYYYQGEQYPVPPNFDADSRMKSLSAVALFVHDEEQVLLATLRSDLAERAYDLLARELGVAANFTQSIHDGLVEIDRADNRGAYTRKIGPTQRYTVNMGTGVRPQRFTKGDHDMEVCMGGRRGISVPVAKEKTSLDELVASKWRYHQALFFQKFLPSEHNFYQKHGKPHRFSYRSPFHLRKNMKVAYSLKRSLPYFSKSLFTGSCRSQHRNRTGKGPVGSLKSIAAIAFENDCRMIAELSLRKLFGALPGSLVAELSACNVRAAHKLCKKMGKAMPVKGWERPLPKGATGLCPAKTLHDDGNSALALGVWTGFTDCSHESPAVLRFVFRDKIVSMATTKKRLAMFHGWLPHLTEHSGEVFNSIPFALDRGEFRSHCSSFLKPEQEFVALTLFSPEHVEATIIALP